MRAHREAMRPPCARHGERRLRAWSRVNSAPRRDNRKVEARVQKLRIGELQIRPRMQILTRCRARWCTAVQGLRIGALHVRRQMQILTRYQWCGSARVILRESPLPAVLCSCSSERKSVWLPQCGRTSVKCVQRRKPPTSAGQCARFCKRHRMLEPLPSFAGHVACLRLTSMLLAYGRLGLASPSFLPPCFPKLASASVETKKNAKTPQLWRKKEARGWPRAQRWAPSLSGNKNTRGWPRQKASTSKSGRAAVLKPASV